MSVHSEVGHLFGARVHLPFVPREIHTLRPKNCTKGRSAVRRVQYEGRINSSKQARVTACAPSEQEYITGHTYALTSMGLRGQVTPLRKERNVFFPIFSFKGGMKLEFEPPRVKNDGNLEEVVPLLWRSERHIPSAMEAERHMLNKTKNINDTEAWRLQGVELRTNYSSKASLA